MLTPVRDVPDRDSCTLRPMAVTPAFLERVKAEVESLNAHSEHLKLTYEVVRFFGGTPDSTNALIVFRWNGSPEASITITHLQSRLIKAA